MTYALKDIKVNSKKRKVSITIAAGVSLCSFIWQKPVLASDLYQLGAFDNTYTDTAGATEVWRGFTFEIGSGYQATYNKVKVWLTDAALPKIRNTVYLYDITGVTNGSAGRQIFAQDLVLGGSNPLNACTVSDGLDRNDYCVGDAATQETLTSGKTYALLARYKPFTVASGNLNDNLYFAQGLQSGAITITQNVILGVPYYSSDNISFTKGSAGSLSYFGPNLGGLQVTSVSPGGESVPAPLPLLGGMAAFGWSRRIRQRITTA